MSHTYAKIISKGFITSASDPNGNPYETTHVSFHSFAGKNGKTTRMSVGKGDGEFFKQEISADITKSTMVEMIKVMTEWVGDMEDHVEPVIIGGQDD